MQHLHELATLFDPSTVALIVEPGEPGGWIAELASQLAEAKVQRRRVALGEPLDDDAAQRGCDLALIAVDASRELDAMRAAATLRARCAVVLSQYATSRRASELAAIARDSRIRLLGPATMGFARPARL